VVFSGNLPEFSTLSPSPSAATLPSNVSQSLAAPALGERFGTTRVATPESVASSILAERLPATASQVEPLVESIQPATVAAAPAGPPHLPNAGNGGLLGRQANSEDLMLWLVIVALGLLSGFCGYRYTRSVRSRRS